MITRHLLDHGRSSARFGFVRNRKLIGTSTLKLGERGWFQVQRDPFTPEDRFLVAELTGDLEFELNRAF